MEKVNRIKDLKNYLSGEREKKNSIGFVPTMGALHEGHLSLVKRCRADNNICVASIFVNPTQFNNKSDLETYPRTPDKDLALLEKAGCDYVFIPSVEEMYPEPDIRQFDFGTISSVMEGAHRPGHFNGVAQIVSKLFYAVEPDRAYFGEKDYQQIAVIRAMVRQLRLPVEVVACPILREADGLAMSSRNLHLTPAQREKAPLIAKTLKESTTFAGKKSVAEVIDFVVTTLNKEPSLHVEYFEIADADTLEPIKHWADSGHPMGFIVVHCGDVRLIDNIKYT